jgi:hypothetical protein
MIVLNLSGMFAPLVHDLSMAVMRTHEVSKYSSTETKDDILSVLDRFGPTPAVKISKMLGMSRESVGTHLNQMAAETPPRVRKQEPRPGCKTARALPWEIVRAEPLTIGGE